MQTITKRNTQKRFEEDGTSKLVKYQEISRFLYVGLPACLVVGI